MNTHCLKWCHRRRWLPILCIAGLAGRALAQAPPETSSSAALLKLNHAIDAYLDRDQKAYETASRELEGLLKDPAASEYQVTCHYYLGLIALERGLACSGESQDVKRELDQAKKQRDQAANVAQRAELEERLRAKGNEALDQFKAAQDHFQKVVSPEDPAVKVVDAAMLLGIAQLARDVEVEAGPDISEKVRAEVAEKAVQLAAQAEQTLSDYTNTEFGARDRYGYFYLAVARYRLADMYGKEGRFFDPAKHVASLNGAARNLEQAAALAGTDAEGKPESEQDQQEFKDYVAYYEGLIHTLAGPAQYAEARERFQTVGETNKGPLAEHAGNLKTQIDKELATHPLPIRIPIPAPIGPWEVDGRIRIGNGFDSNVILLGHDTPLPRGYRSKEGYWFGLSADLNVSRYISRTEAPWVGESLTIGMGGSVGNVWQPAIPKFDVNRYAGRAYVNWQPVRDFYLGFQYEYSYTMLGHEPFISSQRVTPVISKIWRGTAGDHAGIDVGRTDLYYSHDDRNYLDILTNRGFNRDGTYQALGLRHTFNLFQAKELPYLADYFAKHEHERQVFGDQWLSLYLGYEYHAESTVGTEFSLGGNSMIWGLRVPLPYRLAFELDSEFAWSGYTGPSLLDYNRKERADFMQRYGFGITYSIIARGEYAAMRTLDVKLRGGVELTFQDSNIWDRLGEDVYSYNRAMYGVTLEVGF